VADPIFDEATALELLDGDREFLGELLAMFVEAAPLLMEDGRRACARGDATLLMRAAHRLRGNASQIGGARVSECALVVEEYARVADLDAAAHGLAPLAEAVDALCARVAAVLSR